MSLSASWVCATHNIMDGRQLPGLLPHYDALHADSGLHVLCIQENVDGDAEHSHAAQICRRLGAHFEFCVDRRMPRLATLYNTAEVQLEERFLIRLPRLEAWPLIAHFYMDRRHRDRESYALVTLFRPRNHPTDAVAVVNFHLDAAGNNRHRHVQMTAVADGLQRAGINERVIACGDTNVFAWRRRHHHLALDRVLKTLGDFAEVGHGTPDTHFFSRAREPKWAQRMAVLLGRVGIDFPRPIDVVCSDLPEHRRGWTSTPDSDHDLVWVELCVG